MVQKHKIIIGVVVVGVLLIGGCNMLARKAGEAMTEKMIEKATGGKAKVDMKDGSMTVTTDEGTVTTGGSVPDNWPKDVPVYAGATVQFSGTNMGDAGEGAMGLVMTTEDDAAAVATFYKDSLKNGGWTLKNTMSAQGNTVMLFTKDSKNLSLAIAGSNGTTSITIGVQDGTN